MTRVLVFPCGSEIGLEIHRSLRWSTHVDLVGASSIDDHGKFAFDRVVDKLPFIDDPDFLGAFNSTLSREGIDLVYPAHDSVVLTMARATRDRTLACGVIGSRYETCRVARSKRLTYEVLSGVVPTPTVYRQVDDVSSWPVFLKPDVGQGSKGVHRADSAAEARWHLNSDPSLLILQYLPGPEFTVDCFTDRHGALLYAAGRTRSRIVNGISVNSSEVDDARFASMARSIQERVGFRGAWFFQVKEDHDGDLGLLEIAPRVAGTMCVARAKGVNLPLLSVFDALDIDVSITPNSYAVKVDRALQARYDLGIDFQHVYVDLDDLLIVGDRVNQEVVRFLYECIGRGILIHLLTRHNGDLDTTLAKHRLSGLFDSVTHVIDGSAKAAHVTETSAIFLDDSFAERAAVQEARGIPVFDAHAVECLGWA